VVNLFLNVVHTNPSAMGLAANLRIGPLDHRAWFDSRAKRYNL
jgi:hypothetical protein